MWIWIVVCILSIILNIVLGIGVFNLLKKLDIAEEFVFIVRDQIQNVLTTIRKIDERGAFEVDDEVGAAFTGIKETIASLNNFITVQHE